MARLEFTPDQIDARIKTDPEMQQLAQNDPTEFDAQYVKMLRSFGYKPDGSPLGPVQKAIGSLSRTIGIPEDVMKGVASAVLPTALTIGGTMAGGMAGGAGAPAGAVGGAIAGEYANYALGITEEPPTGSDLALTAGFSVLGPIASRTKAGLATFSKRLPGAGLATHPLAAEVLEKNIQHMKIDKADVDMLRGLLGQVPDFKIQVPLMKETIKSELDMATKSLKMDEPYIKELGLLTKTLSDKKYVSFKQLMATEKDLITSGSENSHAVWSKLSGVLINDLERQAENPALAAATRTKIAAGVEQFKMYSAYNKRYQANDALDKILNRSITKVEGGDDMVRFNKKTFIKEMRQNNTLKNTFEPTEIASMEKAIEDIGYLASPPGGGVNRVGGSIHAGVGGALGMAGYAMGGYTGMLVAGLGVTELMRIGVSSDLGRKTIKYLATKGKGRIDAIELNTMLGKVIAGMSAGSVAGVSGAGKAGPEGSVAPFPNEE